MASWLGRKETTVLHRLWRHIWWFQLRCVAIRDCYRRMFELRKRSIRKTWSGHGESQLIFSNWNFVPFYLDFEDFCLEEIAKRHVWCLKQNQYFSHRKYHERWWTHSPLHCPSIWRPSADGWRHEFCRTGTNFVPFRVLTEKILSRTPLHGKPNRKWRHSSSGRVLISNRFSSYTPQEVKYPANAAPFPAFSCGVTASICPGKLTCIVHSPVFVAYKIQILSRCNMKMNSLRSSFVWWGVIQPRLKYAAYRLNSCASCVLTIAQ